MQKQVIKFLESQKFSGLSLVSIKDTTYTFTYQGFSKSHLDKTFGKPSIAGSGKVAVYDCGQYGKLGVSPSNSIVRMIYTATAVERVVDKSHLAKLPVTPELELLFAKGLNNTAARAKFLSQAWTYFNVNKFQGKLVKPKIVCSEQPPRASKMGGNKHTRGYFRRALGTYDAELWIGSFLFNADLEFMVEILVHEMCHQATAEISQDFSMDDQGHGATWQMWMRKVGLDPRRFDPTPNSVYNNAVENAKTDLEMLKVYGPPAAPAELRALKPNRIATSAQGVVIIFHNRICKGDIVRKSGISTFSGVTQAGRRIHLVSDKGFRVYT